MKVYIAGPISSNPDGYRAAFAAAQATLRAEGYETVNPADNPPLPDWQAYMRLSLTQLAECDAIALLPGWESSRGASLEEHIARSMNFTVIELKPLSPVAICEIAAEERE